MTTVIAGLDPAIHLAFGKPFSRVMDTRVKSAYDGLSKLVTYRPTRVQVSPPHSAPTQPSTRSVSDPATEMLLA